MKEKLENYTTENLSKLNEKEELMEAIAYRKHQLKMQPLEEFSSECEVARRNIEVMIKMYYLSRDMTNHSYGNFYKENSNLFESVLKTNISKLINN